MTFTITLPSDASTSIFPDNKTNNYKVKLVNEIRLTEDDWEVALQTISFPDTESVLKSSLLGKYPFVQKVVTHFSGDFGENADGTPNLEDPIGLANNAFYVRESILDLADNPVRDGLSFWKKIIQRTIYEFNNGLQPDELFTNITGDTGMPTYKWVERGNQFDLMIDNDSLHILNDGSYTDISLPLAEAFGLVKEARDFRGNSFWILGESIELIHTTKRGRKVPDPAAYGVVDVPGNRRGRFWKVMTDVATVMGRQDYLRLYGFCNWYITDINSNFERIFGNETRTLFIYTDVAQPQIVGGKQTDMIREVVYTNKFKGRSQFEPLHLQFIPIRKNVFDTIEVAVSEADGQLADIRGGSTILTLLFKRRSEKLL